MAGKETRPMMNKQIPAQYNQNQKQSMFNQTATVTINSLGFLSDSFHQVHQQREESRERARDAMLCRFGKFFKEPVIEGKHCNKAYHSKQTSLQVGKDDAVKRQRMYKEMSSMLVN